MILSENLCLLDGILIQFGTKLYQKIVSIPTSTHYAPPPRHLIADLFLFCYEGDFMLSLSHENQANIEAFHSKSQYLDELLNTDKEYFEQMVATIHPKELQLNKTNTSETEHF